MPRATYGIPAAERRAPRMPSWWRRRRLGLPALPAREVIAVSSPAPPTIGQQRTRDLAAVLGFGLGLAGVVLAVLLWFVPLAMLCGLLGGAASATALRIVAHDPVHAEKRFAITGLLLSALALVLPILLWTIILMTVPMD